MNENPLATRKLGLTDSDITPIGLGCWQFSKQKNMAGKFWPVLEEELIDQVVRQSLHGGINWFDTAEVYGNGASELALSSALQKAGKKPGEVIIATKWWPMMRFASNIGKTIHKRIEMLDPYPINLYQVHQPWGFSNERREVQEMAKIMKQGHIQSVGVSNFSAKQMKNAWETLDKLGLPLVSNQVRYSLLDRKIESNGIMALAKELGITIIAYSPLAQGIVTGKFHENKALLNNIGLRKYNPHFKPEGLAKSLPVIKLVREIAEKYQVSSSQIALNWLIHFHGPTVVAIPGATKPHHVTENTGAMHFKLSEDDLSRLDKASAIFK